MVDQSVEIEILLVGLDNAGKTKLHYTLKNGHAESIIRTLGYNVETIEHNDMKYTIWEIGGHKSVRVLRNFYTEKKSAVIYVLDSSDNERFEEARDDLHDVMKNDNLNSAVLLVLANKTDLTPAFEVETLANILNLYSLSQIWHIHGTSAVKDSRNKLFEILDIIKTMLNSSNKCN